MAAQTLGKQREITVQLHDGDEAEWDAYVSSHPDSCNYHQYGWRKVVEKSFGHRTFYLASRDRNNKLCGILPQVHMKSRLFGSFMVSLPFFNYGGLLCREEHAASLLLDTSRNLLGETGADYVELRHLGRGRDGLVTKQHKVTMILQLETSEEAQWDVLASKVRNQIRKAEKSGLRVTAGHTELLDGFYDVFCRNMRDLGTPVYGKSFFRNVLEQFPATTRIISVTLNGSTVASGLLTWYRDTLEVPWASSIRDFREYCPNNLLYWEAIKFAIGHGAARFDFGRSTPGEGTYHFKKQWGAKPQQLYWQYLLKDGVSLPELSPSSPKYRAAVRMWQRLPVYVTRLLGPPIVRSIP